jgi:putative transposase
MARPPRIPNWLGWDQTTVYFVTFCVEQRKCVLASERAWQTCLATFQRLDQWNILAAISMPDHLHLLGAPLDRDASVASFSKWFKRWFNKIYWSTHSDRDGDFDCRAFVSNANDQKDGIGWCWQEGCFDRLLRSDESLSEKWEYLRQNPVRAGLVSHPEDWPYQFGL